MIIPSKIQPRCHNGYYSILITKSIRRLRLLLGLLLRKHKISPHRQLRPINHIIARMKKPSVLKHQHAAALGLYIDFLQHVPRMKSRRATLESFLPVLARNIIKIEVQSKVRTLLAIWSFVGAVAMCYEFRQ